MYPQTRLRRLRSSHALRNMVRETRVDVSNLIAPLFVVPGEKVTREIGSMPGQFQLSVDTAVEKARQTQPEDAELLVWAAVLNEQLGNTAPAATNLTQAEQKFVGEPAVFWTLVGNHRQQVGNLDGADAAGQQALTLSPTDAPATFLLGSVAEARGDMVQAADYFSRTVTLAGDTNTELGVIAKMRMGNLMPRVEPMPNPAPAETITQTTR